MMASISRPSARPASTAGVQGLLHVGGEPVGHERVLCAFGDEHADASSLFDEPLVDEDRKGLADRWPG